MKLIRTIALNKKGEKALRKQYKQTKQMPLGQRITFKAMYKQEITENPYTLTLTVKNK